MLLPTPKVLIVVVVACFLILFAVNGLHAGRNAMLDDWDSARDSGGKESKAADSDASGGARVWKEIMSSGFKAGFGK